MSLLSYDRYCAEIVAQAEFLVSMVQGADMTTPVPSCPAWNVGQLLRHLGGVHRWGRDRRQHPSHRAGPRAGA